MNTKTLTPIQLRFIDAYVRYGNASKAIRLAYPDSYKQWSDSYIGTKAGRMMQNDEVKQGIANRKAIMDVNATLGTQRIQAIIKDGKEHNALQASMFAIEQVDGKATQVVEQHTLHTMVTYDLSGGQAGEVPAEIMAQLNG